MGSPRNETSVARANKEKGRREKATRGTVVGFKLCDCPGVPREPGSALGSQMMSGNLCRKRWGAGKHSRTAGLN